MFGLLSGQSGQGTEGTFSNYSAKSLEVNCGLQRARKESGWSTGRCGHVPAPELGGCEAQGDLEIESWTSEMCLLSLVFLWGKELLDDAEGRSYCRHWGEENSKQRQLFLVCLLGVIAVQQEHTDTPVSCVLLQDEISHFKKARAIPALSINHPCCPLMKI